MSRGYAMTRNPASRSTPTLAAAISAGDHFTRVVLYDTADLDDLPLSLVGYMQISLQGGKWVVDQAAAQRGYGPMLYELVATLTGRVLHPSGNRSQRALSFWSKQKRGVVEPVRDFEAKYGTSTETLLSRNVLPPQVLARLVNEGSAVAHAASSIEQEQESDERNELLRDERERQRRRKVVQPPASQSNDFKQAAQAFLGQLRARSNASRGYVATQADQPVLIIGAAALPKEPGVWETGMRPTSWRRMVDAWVGTEYEPLLHRIMEGDVIHYDMDVYPEHGDALNHLHEASVVIADHLFYDDEGEGFFYNRLNTTIYDEAQKAGVPLFLFGDYPWRLPKPDDRGITWRLYLPRRAKPNRRA